MTDLSEKSLSVLENPQVVVSFDVNLVSIEEEIGDVFFALICLANKNSIDLEIAVLKTLKKYQNRDRKKKIQKKL